MKSVAGIVRKVLTAIAPGSITPVELASTLNLSAKRVVLPCGNAPISAQAAYKVTTLTGDNNDIIYRAVPVGADGNNIRITYITQSAGSPFRVIRDGNNINVYLVNDGEGGITTTAQDIVDEIVAPNEAAELVTAELADISGDGFVTAMSAISLTNGVDGTTGEVGEVIFITEPGVDQGSLAICTVENTTWKIFQYVNPEG